MSSTGSYTIKTPLVIEPVFLQYSLKSKEILATYSSEKSAILY